MGPIMLISILVSYQGTGENSITEPKITINISTKWDTCQLVNIVVNSKDTTTRNIPLGRQ